MTDSDSEKPSDKPRHSLPLWFRLAVPVLLLLVFLKVHDLEVVLEIDYEEQAFVAALTDIQTYYVPLVLLLLYLLLSAVWKKYFNRDDS